MRVAQIDPSTLHNIRSARDMVYNAFVKIKNGVPRIEDDDAIFFINLCDSAPTYSKQNLMLVKIFNHPFKWCRDFSIQILTISIVHTGIFHIWFSILPLCGKLIIMTYTISSWGCIYTVKPIKFFKPLLLMSRVVWSASIWIGNLVSISHMLLWVMGLELLWVLVILHILRLGVMVFINSQLHLDMLFVVFYSMLW